MDTVITQKKREKKNKNKKTHKNPPKKKNKTKKPGPGSFNYGVFLGRTLLYKYSRKLCNYYHSLKRKAKMMTKRESIVLEVKHPTGTRHSQIVGKMKKHIEFENLFSQFI